MELLNILVRPVITEKSTLLQEQNKYVFEITPNANKIMVKRAVEVAYNVSVLGVNIVKNRGKMKRFGPKWTRTPDLKKAIVTVKSGDTINIFEGA